MGRLLTLGAVFSGLAGIVVVLQFVTGMPSLREVWAVIEHGGGQRMVAGGGDHGPGCPNPPDVVFVFPDSNTRLVRDDELSGLPASKLRIARNEIYARHGLRFKTDLKTYFGCEPWYRPTADDVTDELSPVERQNVQTILSAEKH